MSGTTKNILSRLQRHCLTRNFDIFIYGSTDSYNKRIKDDKKSHVLQYLPSNRLIICVGNSDRLWASAREYMKVTGTENPLNELTQQLATECQEMTKKYYNIPEVQTFFSHKSDPFLISFQRLATCLKGGGILHESSHLVLHHKYGPWHAWRFCFILPGKWDVDHNYIESQPQSIKISEEENNLVNGLIGENSQSYDPALFLKARKMFSIGRAHEYSPEHIAHCYPSLHTY